MRDKIKPDADIALTKRQLALLKPLYEKAKSERERGHPGLIIAQCTTDGRLRAAFIEEDLSLEMIKLTGARKGVS